MRNATSSIREIRNFPAKTQSTTLHRLDGQIGFILLRFGERFTYQNPKGRYPWDYIVQRDRERVIDHFTRVAFGQQLGAIRYVLDNVGMVDEWTCETTWHLMPCSEFPVLGISESWNAVVDSLSSRERQVAKLLPALTVKEISAKLHLSVSTIDKIRHRIGEKVDLLGPALVAWCQSHGDVL
jgi:hypothetical protein